MCVGVCLLLQVNNLNLITKFGIIFILWHVNSMTLCQKLHYDKKMNDPTLQPPTKTRVQ